MRHCVAIGLAILAGLLFLRSLSAGEKPSLMVKGWGEIADPDGDCTIGLDGEKVTLSIPAAAHDYAAELQRWNAPRILADVRGDFIMDVKISGTFKPGEPSSIEGRRGYNGAGILLVKDAKNHLSLQRGAVFLDGKVRHYLNFELRKEGECVISRFEMDLEDHDTILRLERRGQLVYGMASQDGGINWKSYEPIETNFPPVIAAGVEGISSANEPFDCAFSGLSLFRKVEEKPVRP